MEIAVIPAGTSYLTNKEIETSVMALSFRVSKVYTPIVNAANDDFLTDLLGAMQMNVQKQDGSTTDSIIQSLLVKDLAEICSNNVGICFIHETEPGTWELRFTIQLCNGGALALSDRAKLMLAINSIPAGVTVTIDGIDHAASSPTFVKYESKYVNANVGKDFDIDTAYAIAMPIDKLSVLEITYINGRNLKYSAREIKTVLANEQHTVFNRDGLTFFGYGTWAVMNCEEALNVRITMTESGNFYLLKNQAI